MRFSRRHHRLLGGILIMLAVSYVVCVVLDAQLAAEVGLGYVILGVTLSLLASAGRQ